MTPAGRTKSAVRNIVYSLMNLLVPVALVLVQRAVFVRVLDVTYLGVNNLFADVFSMLSLFEMGAGSAIAYYLYQPLAKSEFGKICSLRNLYKTIYSAIGAIVIVVGLILTPFLPHLVKTNQLIPDFQIIYWLQLAKVACSYFSADQRALFVADQKEYLMSKIDLLTRIIQVSVQTVYLWLTKDYIGFIAIALGLTVFQNIVVVVMGKKHYPYAQKKGDPIPKEQRRHIFSRIRAFMLHKFGTVIFNGTDNLMISKLVGLSALGRYANYESLTGFITTFQNRIFYALIPSLGHIDKEESSQHLNLLFRRIFYLNYSVTTFFCICLYFLLSPLITVWLNTTYVLNNNIVIWMVIAFYLNGIRQTAVAFTMARGLFYETRLKPVLEAVLNLLISFILGRTYGIQGVMMGTAFSFLLISWIDPYYLYKLIFNKSITPYVLTNIKFTAWGVLGILAFQALAEYLNLAKLHLLLYALIVIPVAIAIAFVPLLLTEDRSYYKNLFFKIKDLIKL